MKQSRPPLARMYTIDEQLRNGRYPNCSTLAFHFQVNPKTIQRDIDYMRDLLGAPIAYDRYRRGFFYESEWRFLPSIFFDEREIKSLMATRSVLARYDGAPYYQEIRDALDKVLQYLPGALPQHHFLDVYSFARTSGEQPSPECFSVLEEAIRNRRKVRIVYEALRTGETSERIVHPYRLHLAEDIWYLVAICELRNKPRSFMLRRIRRLELLDVAYEPDPDFDPDAYLHERMYLFIAGNGKQTVRIRFNARHAGWIRDSRWHPAQKIVENGDGSLILVMDVDAYDVVTCWLLQYGTDAEVLEPEELRTSVVRKARAIAALYADGAVLGGGA